MKPWTRVLLNSLLHFRPDKFLQYVWAHRLRVKQNSWGYMLTKDGITLLSPTRNFRGFGNTTFHNKFEQHFQIEEGDTCLDVGACIGDTTIPMLEKSKASVIAVEPDPANLKFLKLNLLSYPNASIVPKAAFNKKGTMPLHLHPSIAERTLTPAYPIYQGQVTVETDTLDDILNGTKVDFAKIDVQGSEVEVLNTAPKFLSTAKKLVVETHHRNSPQATYPTVITILSKYNFTIHYEHATGVVHASR